MKIGIVDPYSTATQLVERLCGGQIELIHIESGLDVPATMREHHVASHFSERVMAAELFEAADTNVGLETFDWIIAGSESGVTTADALASLTAHPMFPRGVPSKYEVGLRLEPAGVRSPRTESIRAVDQIDLVLGAFSYPVVVKPLWSATGDGVKLCHNRREVLEACAAALNRPNIYGAVIDEVLIQEYLPGDEYYCNTVSVNGRHAAIEVWRYMKRKMDNGGWIYVSEEHIPLEEPVGIMVAAYCRDVLEALEFENGAAHLEVMVDRNGRATLVEANYRLGGATNAAVIDRVTGNSQVRAFAALLRGEVNFDEATHVAHSAQAMRNVFLMPISGGLINEERAALLRTLPNVQAVDLHSTTNDRDAESTLLASPGFIFLAGRDPLVLEGVELRIRELEEAVHV